MERMRGNSKKVMKRRKRRRAQGSKAGLMKVGRTMIVIGRKCAALSILESKSEDLSPNENNELTNI